MEGRGQGRGVAETVVRIFSSSAGMRSADWLLDSSSLTTCSSSCACCRDRRSSNTSLRSSCIATQTEQMGILRCIPLQLDLQMRDLLFQLVTPALFLLAQLVHGADKLGHGLSKAGQLLQHIALVLHCGQQSSIHTNRD
ncbi:hypothetical protein JZ751_012482 [Albula glossodonta]|uniref:Uncharacterized protein n=1 Tax=Albula glossodonta TaxID=121402 RepID=A0A8T2NWX0_9TELE|nr:hypothetical protein JZ751_012482 [Albula glossodonta]